MEALNYFVRRNPNSGWTAIEEGNHIGFAKAGAALESQMSATVVFPKEVTLLTLTWSRCVRSAWIKNGVRLQAQQAKEFLISDFGV